MTPDKQLENEVLRITGISFAFVLAGQFGRDMMTADDVHLFSQFHRHHFSNLLDGAAVTACLTSNLKDYLKTSWQKTATLSAAITLTAGFMYETYQASLPDRTFDNIDCLVYVPSAIACSMYIRHRENQIKPVIQP